MLLYVGALKLKNNQKIMDSYWDYYNKDRTWFFSPNGRLAGATSKPSFSKIEAWKKLPAKKRAQFYWNDFSSKQRMTICSLGGFGEEGKRVNLEKTEHFSRLINALKYWPDELFTLFWHSETKDKSHRYLCNVFLGDALYYAGCTTLNSEKHYYSPEEIVAKKTSFREITDYKQVMIGDIVVFKNAYHEWSHVEIITEVRKHWFIDDGFCSIGAGRGDARTDLGSIRCDGILEAMKGNESRELVRKKNKYFRPFY